MFWGLKGVFEARFSKIPEEPQSHKDGKGKGPNCSPSSASSEGENSSESESPSESEEEKKVEIKDEGKEIAEKNLFVLKEQVGVLIKSDFGVPILCTVLYNCVISLMAGFSVESSSTSAAENGTTAETKEEREA